MPVECPSASPHAIACARAQPALADPLPEQCGAVAEWSKALAWKVSIRQKRIEGSNPSRSATPREHTPENQGNGQACRATERPVATRLADAATGTMRARLWADLGDRPVVPSPLASPETSRSRPSIRTVRCGRAALSESRSPDALPAASHRRPRPRGRPESGIDAGGRGMVIGRRAASSMRWPLRAKTAITRPVTHVLLHTDQGLRDGR